ncbi:hypothetical protein ACIGBH_41330 [Streptomyces sp. NPDC085929]|uniref:hypothetical protein n=1 Tax=Streptomyces sp. NPDC085929 TaxID=3365739 RepID=UPI0037D07C24
MSAKLIIHPPDQQGWRCGRYDDVAIGVAHRPADIRAFLARRRVRRHSPAQPRATAGPSLMEGGRSNGAIATDLGPSRQALDYHVCQLRAALDADSRPALVARAYTLGILDTRVWPPRAAVPPYQG